MAERLFIGGLLPAIKLKPGVLVSDALYNNSSYYKTYGISPDNYGEWSNVCDATFNDLLTVYTTYNSFTPIAKVINGTTQAYYTRQAPLVSGNILWFYVDSTIDPIFMLEHSLSEPYVVATDNNYNLLMGVSYEYYIEVTPTFTLFIDDNNNVTLAQVIQVSATDIRIKSGGFTGNSFANENFNSKSVESEPEPEPSEGGRFGLDNRFSPRIASNSFGMYVMNNTELQGIMRGLWTKSFSEWFTQKIGITTEPTQMLLGCKWYYGIRKDIMLHDGKEVPIMGNLAIQSALPSSETQVDVPMNFLRKEFCIHDCGSITVPAHFNNYLDYQSKYQLYLPFLGFIELNPSDIVGGSIHVRYNINMATGYAMIIITANNDRTNNKDVEILTVPCECGITVPLTFTEINSLGNNIIQSIGKSVAAGITSGAGVGFATKSGLSAMSVAEYNEDYGEWASAVSNTANNIRKIQGAGIAGGLATAFNGGVPSVGRSGDLTSEGGTVGSLKPFLLITRPVKITPTNIHDIYGKRSVAIKKLSDCTGYTKVSAVKPGSLPTNNKYIEQIVSTLQAGVYL